MPIYDFLCRDCEHRYDDLVRMDAEADQACPECRSADVVKLYSPFSVGASSTSTTSSDYSMGGACMPGPAGGRSGGCCGGGCGGCG